jgi:ribonuclease E/ribonuclease G
MSERLVLDSTGFTVRGALFRDDRLIDLLEADLSPSYVTDALFWGQVVAVDQRLNAAFVDIGQEQPAFLNAKDARHHRSGMRESITRLLREGERLVVQGVREAEPASAETGSAGKGPRVTTDLKLFGFYTILRPHGRAGEAMGPARGVERQALQARAASLFPEGDTSLRKLARDVGDDALRAERDRLAGRWAELSAAAAGRERPGRLGVEDHPLERLLRVALSPLLQAIEVADDALATRLHQILRGPLATHPIELVRLDPKHSAFEQTEAGEELELALAREVALRGGGRLVVEPVTAFTAIDVDGGGRAAMDVDLEAAAEVARLARLRNLGGSIVVDFVDLPTRAQQQRLEAALKKAFRDDPLPVDVYPMSPLGIVQISRARRGVALDARLRRACPACGGSGRIASLRLEAETLIGQLRRHPSSPRQLRAAPDLHAFLGGEGAPALAGAAPGLTPALDPQLPPGGFAIDG